MVFNQRWIVLIAILFFQCETKERTSEPSIQNEIRDHLDLMLDSWYPTCIDVEFGGYLSDLDKDFNPFGDHDKMLVSQARHLWTTSKVFKEYNKLEYQKYAEGGFQFLRDRMWDQEFGGFYQWVDRTGIPLVDHTQKTAYGNAFAIYGLAAYFDATRDSSAFELMRGAFNWLDENSHDDQWGGYFQHLERNGSRIPRTASTPSTSDLGYKDYNSSIHLLEAFSSLYLVWPDPVVRERLQEMFLVVRDTIVNDRYFMNFYFEDDWSGISFADSSREVIDQHYNLDHVSFTHDIETAYLLMEAAEVLGIEVDETLTTTDYMMKHALKGWDAENGGLFDGGYYFQNKPDIEIIRTTKSWWGQAETLHSLALFHRYFPDGGYDLLFEQQWKYLKRHMIDSTNHGWFVNGLDTDPEAIDKRKGQVWKTTYHNYRALSNILKMKDH